MEIQNPDLKTHPPVKVSVMPKLLIFASGTRDAK